MSEIRMKMNKRTPATLSAFAALAVVLAACAPAATPAPAAPTAPAATEAPAAEAPAATEAPAAATEATDFVTWYQYDATNEDPKSDERVGNQYLRDTIPLFNEAYKGKWNWVNQPQPFDKMEVNLVAAVQAGGEVPDLMQSGAGSLQNFIKNGTVQDLSEWAKAQPWFADLDPASVNACTVDGKLYCIPVAQSPQVVFYWTGHFPNGYPKTVEEFNTAAEELKAKNIAAITFCGTPVFDGTCLSRFMYTAISSFGGKLDDGAGKMALNTPENVKAIEWMRDIVAKGYAHPRTFDGQQTPFVEEEPMKTAEAASFPTGIFGYRYVNPLKAPNGTEYKKGNEEDMLDAIAAGDAAVAPFFTGGAAKPGCGIDVSTFVIPTSAKNVDAAYDYINWIMSADQNAAWVQGPGGGFPALKTTLATDTFNTPFYKQSAEVVAASACTPWWGSLDRRGEAAKIVTAAIYKLIKEDPTADIAATLTAAEEEYNKGG